MTCRAKSACANTPAQVGVEYRWSQAVRLAAHRAQGTAGSCQLSGGFPCSTQGLGGSQAALGAMYAINGVLGVFALAVRVDNGAAARYGSSAQGAATSIYAAA